MTIRDSEDQLIIPFKMISLGKPWEIWKSTDTQNSLQRFTKSSLSGRYYTHKTAF